jgi:sulfonate transport system substrate-binding protein
VISASGRLRHKIHHRKWRAGLFGVAGLALLMALAACGSGSTNSGKTSASGSASLSGVTLVIGDQESSLQDLANASGEFKNTPYKIKWAEFNSGALLFQAVAAGKTDAQSASDLTTLQAINGGLSVKFVAAALSNGSSTSIVVQGNSGISSVADLKGKNVVLSSAAGGIAEYLLANVLQQAGLNFSDVNVQYVPFVDGEAAFAAHKITVWGTNGIYALTAVQKDGGRLLVDGEQGRTSGVGFISATPSALANPGTSAALKDFLHRYAEALAWEVQNKAEYAAIYAKDNDITLANAQTVIDEGLGYLVPVSPTITARSQAVANLMAKLGQLKSGLNVAALSTTGLFPAVLPGTPTDGLPAGS